MEFDWRTACFDAENRYMEIKRDFQAVIEQRNDLDAEINEIVAERDHLAAIAIGFFNNIFTDGHLVKSINQHEIIELIGLVSDYICEVNNSIDREALKIQTINPRII
jgi:hypothetical protein